jgi:hypothetical protein
MFNKKRKIVLAVILVAILALLFAKYYENNSIERDIKNKWGDSPCLASDPECYNAAQ